MRRKRSSATPVSSYNRSSSNDATTMELDDDGDQKLAASVSKDALSRPKLRVRIKKFHGVAKWTWNVGDDADEDEVCGICQSAYEGCPPGVKFPGDEAPVVFGVCGHSFHLQCVATWLTASRQTCPICRANWEYGNSTGRSTNNNDTGGNDRASNNNNNNNRTSSTGGDGGTAASNSNNNTNSNAAGTADGGGSGDASNNTGNGRDSN